MNTRITPALGSTVLYTLTEFDAKAIIQERLNAGRATARGNDPREGDTYPAIIVREFVNTRETLAKHFAKGNYSPEEAAELVESSLEANIRDRVCNLRVLLDGTDVFWATSRSRFDAEKHGRWVQVSSSGEDQELPPGYAESDLGAEDRAAGDIQFRADSKGRWTEVPTEW